MPYSSCWIDNLAPVGVSAVPDLKSARQPFVRDLQAPDSGHYLLPAVTRWAEKYGIDIHHWNNCWIEIELSAEGLRDFIRDVYGPGIVPAGPSAPSLKPNTATRWWRRNSKKLFHIDDSSSGDRWHDIRLRNISPSTLGARVVTLFEMGPALAFRLRPD
jgi:hypothetical protein